MNCIDIEMFTKILVPFDGSDHSQKALETAIDLAKQFDGEITLIHVYSVSIVMSLSMYYNESNVVASQEVSRLAETIREASAEILAKGEKMVKAEGIPVETLLREGHVVQEIIKTVREGRFDLIVIGAKGMSKVKEMFLGSVSEKVVRNAPCTVMVVK